MIAFGVWVEDEACYRRIVLPGLHTHAEPDSPVLESTTDGCIFEAYDEILDAAAGMAGLEALVLVRDDVELRDPQLLPKLRAAVGRPGIAVAGPVGASHVTSLRWWEGDVVGRIGHLGTDGAGPVHVLDGGLLALSPDAVRALRFDRRVWSGAHGYAAELCTLARAAGGRVDVVDLDVVKHGPSFPPEDVAFLRADMLWRARWSWEQ